MAIRIVVVDDSAFMRSALKAMLEADPELKVVATARDGEDALEKIKANAPDLVTMDIEMPRMDGITATRAIMQASPLPILIVSSLSEEGAQATLDAIDAGAVDFVCKNLGTRSMNVMNIANDLVLKIKEIVKRKGDLQARPWTAPRAGVVQIPRKAVKTTGNVLLVAIGVSTGGPKALQEMIPYLPEELSAGVVIVQHMPAAFTKSFAERLDSTSKLRVKEAEPGDIVKPGLVLVARGGKHLRLTKSKLDVGVEISDVPKETPYKPSVNEFMLSAVKAYGGRVLGVIMTGMGNDGLMGMRAIKNAGGKTMAQDEKSCVIYGMPKAVVDEGLADKIVPLEQMANEIVNMV